MLEPNLKPGLAATLPLGSTRPSSQGGIVVRGARARGARLAVGVTAGRISREGTRVVAVETSAGRVAPRFIVSATGWTAAWLQGSGVTLPLLRSVTGQLISTSPIEPVLRGAVGGKYLVLQLRSGEIVTGGNLVESEDVVPDPDLNRQFAEAAADLIPRLTDVPFCTVLVVRAVADSRRPAGHRRGRLGPQTIYFWHFRNGMLLAPATGALLSEWILKGIAPPDLAHFRADRFKK